MLKTRVVLFLAASLSLVLLTSSCFSQPAASAYYDAGAQDLTVTGKQMSQYVVYRFDTSGGARTMTLPPAADIISQIGSPTVGQIFIMAVSAEGGNEVRVVGGSGVTVKASASSTAANTTQNLYFVVMNVTSGSQAVSVY